jgi:hypothetical protein
MLQHHLNNAHIVCNIQHQELPLLLDTQTSHVCNNENSTSATLKFNVCNTQQHASATSKLDVCNRETSKSTFATSRLIHMQHVSEIVTRSQHLDLLLQHSHETLANILQKHPKYMQHTLATAPKLCLLATMNAARSSSSWPRGAAAPPVSSHAWPQKVKPWPPAKLSAEAAVRSPVRSGHGEQRPHAAGGLPLPAARGSAAGGEAARARPPPPWPPRALRGYDPHHTRCCRRRGEVARIRHRHQRRGRSRPSLSEKELASMPSMVWGRRRKGERELREKNGRRLVGAGDIYDGQLFLHVVENRPRRRPIFSLRLDVCS